MKNFLACICIMLLFNSCDDGDLTIVSFEFAPGNVRACQDATDGNRFFLYNTQDKRAFILKIPEDSFKNENTVGEAIPIEINATNTLIYREYSGTVTSGTICSDIPASTPVVTKEYIATGGKIYITTSVVKDPDATNGSTKITGYNHSIVIKDITFSVDGGTQKNEEINFGIYNETQNAFAVLSTTAATARVINKCSGSNVYYTVNGPEGVTLIAESSLFANTPDVIKTATINGTTTALRLSMYANNLTPFFFCTTPNPTFPTLEETWLANSGGIIEVTTTTSADDFIHTVTLKNVTFAKGNVDFNLGEEFILGNFTTTN